MQSREKVGCAVAWIERRGWTEGVSPGADDSWWLQPCLMEVSASHFLFKVNKPCSRPLPLRDLAAAPCSVVRAPHCAFVPGCDLHILNDLCYLQFLRYFCASSLARLPPQGQQKDNLLIELSFLLHLQPNSH